MNDTTFQGDGKVAYVPVVVNTMLTKCTNADRIRRMTDEELAEWVNSPCPPNTLCDLDDNLEPKCKDCWLKWLKKEEEDGKET